MVLLWLKLQDPTMSREEQKVARVWVHQAAGCSIWLQTRGEAGAEVPDKVFCSSSRKYLIWASFSLIKKAQGKGVKIRS